MKLLRLGWRGGTIAFSTPPMPSIHLLGSSMLNCGWFFAFSASAAARSASHSARSSLSIAAAAAAHSLEVFFFLAPFLASAAATSSARQSNWRGSIAGHAREGRPGLSAQQGGKKSYS